MEKLGVEIDQEKVKEAEKKPGGPGSVKPKRPDPETEKNVPWDPEKGTEPFEKKPEPKQEG